MTSALVALKQKTLDGMLKYMRLGGAENEQDPHYDPEFEAGYTQEHVTECGRILDEYLEALEDLPDGGTDESILAQVKATLIQLNHLNDRCLGNLIETDQREQLCALIQGAAEEAGLESDESDITEEWREW
jgi:hypothetical protein